MMSEPIDRCQICLFEAEESVFEDTYKNIHGDDKGLECPVCHSNDIDDTSFKPYMEDDSEGDELV